MIGVLNAVKLVSFNSARSTPLSIRLFPGQRLQLTCCFIHPYGSSCALWRSLAVGCECWHTHLLRSSSSGQRIASQDPHFPLAHQKQVLGGASLAISSRLSHSRWSLRVVARACRPAYPRPPMASAGNAIFICWGWNSASKIRTRARGPPNSTFFFTMDLSISIDSVQSHSLFGCFVRFIRANFLLSILGWDIWTTR